MSLEFFGCCLVETNAEFSGIPIVEAVSDEQARKDPLAEKPIKFNEAEEQERKKRTRGDDDGATENDAKKAKTEIEA